LKILHANASDITGGAARAAYRIHSSLMEYGERHGMQSHTRLISKFSDAPT
jgi:hypothetical protein